MTPTDKPDSVDRLELILEQHLHYATQADKFNGLSTVQAKQAIRQWISDGIGDDEVPVNAGKYAYQYSDQLIRDELRQEIRQRLGI